MNEWRQIAPEYDGRYLVTATEDGESWVTVAHYHAGDMAWYDGPPGEGLWLHTLTVTGWMPLPEPWR